MPNVIKYTVGSTPTGCLRKGNMLIGNNTTDYGATFYNGINPPAGGYTIYLNKASGGPSIYCPANDTQLIFITNQIAGASYTTAAQCLDYFASQTDKIVVNFNYEGIVTNGLVLNLDAGFNPSYPTTGTTWYDLSGNTNNGTLTNGPTFNSANSGSIVFDGIDDNVQRNALNVGNNFTVCVWARPNSATRKTLVANSYNYSGASTTEGFLFNIGNAGTDMFISLGRDSYGKISPTGLISANTWFYACASYNGSTINLYFNGIDVGGNFFGSPITITYNSQPFYLAYWVNNGTVYSGDVYAGRIGITQIYNRALTAAEVLQNYNAQKGRYGL